MSDAEIKSVIDAAFDDCISPSIGFSGGEAFIYFDRLCVLVEYAIDRGAFVSINTNGFWGRRQDLAERYASRMKALGVSKLVVSTDSFHTPFVSEKAVIGAIRACVTVDLEVEVQFVYAKGSERLHDFIARWADDLVNISCREIPMHPVGRAGKLGDHLQPPVRPGTPLGRCPSAIPSIAADGRVIPCCNTAGHLAELELGNVREGNIVDIFRRFHESSLFYVLWKYGPAKLRESALNHGFKDPVDGYVDQCHLCYDLFSDSRVAQALKRDARSLYETDALSDFQAQYREAQSNGMRGIDDSMVP